MSKPPLKDKLSLFERMQSVKSTEDLLTQSCACTGLDMEVIEQVIRHCTKMIFLLNFVWLVFKMRIHRPGVRVKALSKM